MVSSFLHRLLTCLVILWLAIFYPAMCQFHGLMLFRAPQPAEHRRHHPPGPDTATHMHQMEQSGHMAASAAGPATPAMRHAKLPVGAAVMSLAAMALPSATLPWPVHPVTSQQIHAPAFAHQAELSPPDEPPRVLPA